MYLIKMSIESKQKFSCIKVFVLMPTLMKTLCRINKWLHFHCILHIDWNKIETVPDLVTCTTQIKNHNNKINLTNEELRTMCMQFQTRSEVKPIEENILKLLYTDILYGGFDYLLFFFKWFPKIQGTSFTRHICFVLSKDKKKLEGFVKKSSRFRTLGCWRRFYNHYSLFLEFSSSFRQNCTL